LQLRPYLTTRIQLQSLISERYAITDKVCAALGEATFAITVACASGAALAVGLEFVCLPWAVVAINAPCARETLGSFLDGQIVCGDLDPVVALAVDVSGIPGLGSIAFPTQLIANSPTSFSTSVTMSASTACATSAISTPLPGTGTVVLTSLQLSCQNVTQMGNYQCC
jgi:hypothetical protein